MCSNRSESFPSAPATARWAAAVAAILMFVFSLTGCGKSPGGGPPGSTAAAGASANSATPVVTTAVRTGDVSRTVPVTGSLVALQDVSLSAKQGGRIESVAVREGDTVTAGQVLARINASDLEAQTRSAAAAVDSARAKLAQAQAAYNQQRTSTETSITSARAAYQQQVATSAAQVRSAQAALVSARANLSTVKEGARPEERTQTQASLASAEANLKKAQSDDDRYQKLHAAGAISDAEMDQYDNARDVAQSSLRSARAAAELQQKGNRRQEVEQAEQQVRQAEETLRQMVAGKSTNAVKKADLDAAIAARAQNAVKLADVQAAQASLEESQNSLTIARQAVRDAVVVSPITGRISSRTAEPGQVVTSGATLLKVISLDNVYFEPSVPNSVLGQIKVGQSVSVKIDAFPGRTLTGTVSRIYPEGSSSSRTFPIRVTLNNRSGSLRPQMFAQGQITTEIHKNVALIPREAMVSDGDLATGTARFFVVENGVAHQKTAKLGLTTPDNNWVEAQGVSPDAQIVTLGQRTLSEGQKVAPTSSQATTSTQTTFVNTTPRTAA
jgi:HlyD family secretion protein